MRPICSSDGELEPMLQRAVSWLEENGIGVFWGQLERAEGLSAVEWNSEIVPEPDDFLCLAKAAGATLVFVDVTRCDRAEMAKITALSANEEGREPVSNLSSFDGQIAQFSLSWIGEHAVLEFTRSASWAQAYFDLREPLGEDNGGEDDVDEETLPDEAEVAKHANTLAMDSKFQAAKSDAQRRYAAKQALGVSVATDRGLLEAVTEEAKSIFALEIKPELDRRLAAEVDRLKAQGLTKAQIARQLGISAERI